MPAPPRNPIGTHVLVGKGLVEGAFASARALGCEAVQVFCGNPRGWTPTPGDPAQDAAFARACAQAGMPAFVHAPYLVNVGSPNPEHHARSVALVAHNLDRARRIGAQGVVVHTGSAVGGGTRAAALRRVREGLLPVLDTLGAGDPWLLLEPTAGQGRSLCSTVDELEPYLAALDHHPRAGVCLDTCHFFAAGEPLDEPGGTTAVVDRVVGVAGPGRLRLVHANDSKDPRGSHRDRHERIGQGRIGLGCFEELLAHPALDGVPLILETPGSRLPGDAGLVLLKQLRDRVSPPPAPQTSAPAR